ncbi:MAG: mgtA 1 [Marmoricola sp.]|nr:mgtA 1 [Marmoricola sp.]
MSRENRRRTAEARPPVAIAIDYLTQRRGAERVVLAMARAYPGAPIYTSVYEPELTYAEFRDLDIRVTPLNRFRLFRRNHRWALPLYAPVVSRTTIDADVVLAASSGWSHGFRSTGKMLVYCFSPAHWLYNGDFYLGEKPSVTARFAMAVLGSWLRRWDRRAAADATEYLAISTVVQSRIRREYGRSSRVVPAPIPAPVSQPEKAVPAAEQIPPGDPGFYLCVSSLLPYKHVGAVVETFAHLASRRLVVVGSGQLEHDLAKIATPNVTFVKDISDAELVRLYSNARALIAVAYEDYGLTPIEAAVAGTPSIVLRWGGYLDTMVEDVTATFVEEPTPAAIAEGITRFEARTWDADAIRDHAVAFSEATFIQTIQELVKDL